MNPGSPGTKAARPAPAHVTRPTTHQGEAAARFDVRAAGEQYTSSDPVTAPHPR
ncbi:hypothetical protein AB0D30_29980 [Streptomyces sp. NPDC048409]|uniref:hypothetical protein n=1 Tax=unclassified Streptomyces TaxID=2593676 RepID=UPI0034231576